MPKVNWVVQQNLIKEETLMRLRKAFLENQVSYQEVFVVPFSNELPAIEHQDAFHIFYGSTTLMLNAFGHPLYRQGVFYYPDRFQMAAYLTHWKNHLLNSDGMVTSLREIAHSNQTDDSTWFIRPNADTKAFSGTVMSIGQIEAWAENLKEVEGAELTLDSQVFISSPKQIDKEWRTFIVKGQVVSASRYQLKGELSVSAADVPADMIAFVEARCQEYTPHAIFVMDVALLNDMYYVLECNCFNGTGFYANDISKVIRVVTAAIEQDHTLLP